MKLFKILKDSIQILSLIKGKEMNKSLKLLLIEKRENTIMEEYAPSYEMLPIHNIVKSHLVIAQHSSEKLCPQIIDALSMKITETIDAFLKKNFKEKR